LQGISISAPNSDVMHRATNSLHSLFIRFQLSLIMFYSIFCHFCVPK
jgi:hypothetical protein